MHPFYSSQIRPSAMNSCFPPLAALTLKDKRRNSSYLETTGNQTSGKPNVIQDMEMFYIKQIAHNLKVRTKKNFQKHFKRIYILFLYITIYMYISSDVIDLTI